MTNGEIPILNYSYNALDLFPEHIIGNETVVYHGSCALNLFSIQEKGLVNGFTPHREILNEVSELIQSIDPPNQELDKINKRITAFLKRTNPKLCFTISSYEALFYSLGVVKGGQSLLAIEDAIPYLMTENLDAESNQIIEKANNVLDKYRASDGAVLVIRINNETRNKFLRSRASNSIAHGENRMDSIEFFGEQISPIDIIAAVRIPQEVLIDEDKYLEAVRASRSIASNPQCAIGQLRHSIMG